ncbi:MAG: hypothetical protein FWE06_02450 [Oscillospiraceae bacterium]|nr:hypothetical protein [Oscillospiraceae bacterium]
MDVILTTSVFEREGFLTIPKSISKVWEIKCGDHLYAKLKDGNVTLQRENGKNLETVAVLPGFDVQIPEHFADRLGFPVCGEVQLKLENDVLTIYKTNVISIFSPQGNRERLRRKLDAEFEMLFQKSRSELLEDIYTLLLLTELKDETVKGLLALPNALQHMRQRIRGDDEFEAFLEKKVKELTDELTDEFRQ